MNVALFMLKTDYDSSVSFINLIRFHTLLYGGEKMPLWGWMLVFFGGLLFVGFVADLISKKKRSTDSRSIQNQIDEVKNNQTDYHNFL